MDLRYGSIALAVGRSFVGDTIDQWRNNRPMMFTSIVTTIYTIHETCSASDVAKRSAIVSAALYSAISQLCTMAVRVSIRALEVSPFMCYINTRFT